MEEWNKSIIEIAGLLGRAPYKRFIMGVKVQLSYTMKGPHKKVYSADYAETVYQFNQKTVGEKLTFSSRKSERRSYTIISKNSPEMMVNKKQVKLVFQPSTTGFHNGHLEVDEGRHFIPEKGKVSS